MVKPVLMRVRNTAHIGNIHVTSVSSAGVLLFGDTKVIIADAQSATTPVLYVGRTVTPQPGTTGQVEPVPPPVVPPVGP